MIGNHKGKQAVIELSLLVAQIICEALQIIRSEFIILIAQNMIVSWANRSLHNITSSKLSRNLRNKNFTLSSQLPKCWMVKKCTVSPAWLHRKKS
jgi:hypothetical protein